MPKIFKTLFLFSLLLLPAALAAKDEGAPKDFKFVYRSSAGQLEQATKEEVEVSGDKITVTRRAKPIGSVGMQDDSRSYAVSAAQGAELWRIVQESGFLTWPKNPEGPHQSHVEEAIEVTAKGKTVRHSRWEQGNEQAFRALFDRYNSWFNGVRTVRF